jgi:hypothetical protein
MATVYGAIDIDIESQLAGRSRPLTTTDDGAARLPPVRMLGRLPDLSHDGTWTRQRGMAKLPDAPERFSSEAYPVAAPPTHVFAVGTQARMLGRDPRPLAR